MIVLSQSKSGRLKSPSNTTDSSLSKISPIFRSRAPTISSVLDRLYDVGWYTRISTVFFINSVTTPSIFRSGAGKVGTKSCT